MSKFSTKDLAKHSKTYATQLSELSEMGFTGQSHLIRALLDAKGDVQGAVNWLLTNPSFEEEIITESVFSFKGDELAPDAPLELETWYPVVSTENNLIFGGQSAFSYQDKVYLLAGNAKDPKSMSIYQHSTKSVKCVQLDMGLPNADYSASQYGGFVIILGGMLGMSTLFPACVCVDLVNATTRLISMEGMIPLEGHSSCVFGDSLYVFGGYDAKGVQTKQLRKLDLLTHKWSTVDVKGNLPCLSHLQMAVAGCHIYIHGGVTENVPTEVQSALYRFNVFTLQFDQILHDKPIPRRNGQLLKLNDDTLLLVGGIHHGSKIATTIHSYSIESKTWERKSTFPVVTKPVCVIHNHSKLLLFGEPQQMQFGSNIYPNIYQYRTTNHGYKVLFGSSEFSDVKLSIGGVKVPAHKAILSQISTLDLTKDFIEITYDPSTFYRALKYLYGFPLIVSGKDLFELVGFSQEVGLKDLEIHCVHQLGELTPFENLDLLKRTDENLRISKKQRFYPHDDLKNYALDNFQKNKKSLDSIESFKLFESLDKDLKIEILTAPGFEGDQGIVSLDKDRSEQLIELFDYLRSMKQYCDLVIVAKDNKYLAHCGLFLNSPYFMNKLSTTKEVDLSDADPLAVKLYYSRVYDPNTELTEKEEKIFEAFCKKYDVGIDATGLSSSKFVWDTIPPNMSCKDKYTLSQTGSDPRLGYCSTVIKKTSPEVHIQFKLTYFSWIGLGVVQASKVDQKDFSWNYSGGFSTHGTNLWSMNGWCWSTDASTHSKQTFPAYTANDIIELKVVPKKGCIQMKKLSDPSWGVEMKCEFPVCICANLGGTGDSVEILQKKMK